MEPLKGLKGAWLCPYGAKGLEPYYGDVGGATGAFDKGLCNSRNVLNQKC